ncbi:EF-hand domain-containing protein [Sphingomonas abietis]|uniref:Histidine kinase n=1 Tax=Sphingomonas abietis TaxID=3012344 RepID=A0ABY7NIA7_9SPHN|nr:histidine kinase [Sphingomonas abietis]WBO21249.1 histidine kinase [Sphingomonas abietis]
MWRYLAGVASALFLVTAGFLIWTGLASRDEHIPPPPVLAQAFAAPVATAPVAVDAPQATEQTREQKRFSRSDHNKDGKIDRDEYLAARRRNFAKLDSNGDGKLSFDEYAVKGEAKFAAADADRSGALDPQEFATTRVVRKARPRCPPAGQAAPAATDSGEDNG